MNTAEIIQFKFNLSLEAKIREVIADVIRGKHYYIFIIHITELFNFFKNDCHFLVGLYIIY